MPGSPPVEFPTTFIISQFCGASPRDTWTPFFKLEILEFNIHSSRLIKNMQLLHLEHYVRIYPLSEPAMEKHRHQREELERHSKELDRRKQQEQDIHNALAHPQRFCHQGTQGLDALNFEE